MAADVVAPFILLLAVGAGVTASVVASISSAARIAGHRITIQHPTQMAAMPVLLGRKTSLDLAGWLQAAPELWN